MNKINELIMKNCSNGVEYKKLKEIGKLFTGLTGKSKNDFENGNCRYITYTNIYNNAAVRLDKDDFVYIKENERQNYLLQGDILITGSSESIEDSGMISVVVDEPKEKIYLNSFCFGLRLNNKYKDKILPGFSKHIFRSEYFRNQILMCSFGVTRFNLNKKMFMELKIPIPPVEVQDEIVRVLDKFNELETELETELEKRKIQYEYYIDKIISEAYKKGSIEIENVVQKTENINWNSQKEEKKYIDLSSVNRENNSIIATTDINFQNAPSRARQIIKSGDIIFGTTRPLLKRVCIISEEYDNQICSTGYCVLRPEKEKALPKWIYFNLLTNNFYKYVEKFQQGASYPSISDLSVKKYKIPLLSTEEQEIVVNILDKFDKLINSIKEGLPAEIELRKKQYEYYRNKLLNFKEVINK